MTWLSQNWIWIALAVGAFFFMTRMGRMGGCGTSRSTRRGYNESADRAPPARGSGFGPAFSPGGSNERSAPVQSAGTAVDPVTRHAVAAGGPTISSVYHGRAYYFESRENRDAFEASPEKYLAGTEAAGQVIEADRDDGYRRHRRSGC